MKRNGFVHLILVFFIAVALLIGPIYYFRIQKKGFRSNIPDVNNVIVNTTPSPVPQDAIDSSSGWKTFTKIIYHDNVKYTFNYPPHWKVNELTTSDDVTMECEPCAKEENIDFVQIIRTPDMSINEYIEKQGELKADIEKIKFKGLDAVKSTTGGGTEGAFVGIFFVQNGKSYLIDYRYPDLKYFNTKKLSELPNPIPDIPSTFEFLK